MNKSKFTYSIPLARPLAVTLGLSTAAFAQTNAYTIEPATAGMKK